MAYSFDPSDLRLFPETAQFPIAVQAADPDGQQAFYFVKKEDAQLTKYRTELSIRNISGGPISISKSDDAAHFTLRFRPGLVNAHLIQSILPSASELESQMGTGWVQNAITTDSDTGVIIVGFRFTGTNPFTWLQRSVLSLQLRPVPYAPLSGAFFVKMELDYSGIIGGAPLLLNLAAVDLSGQTHFPATALIKGSNTILNDGAAVNKQVVLVKPNQRHASIPLQASEEGHETGTTITVAIRYAETEAKMAHRSEVMGYKPDDSSSIDLNIQGLFANNSDTETSWTTPIPDRDGTPGWVTWSFTPEQTCYLNYDTPAAASDEILRALQFTFSNIKSSAPDGLVYVHIHFHHVPGYADQTLLVPLQKGPIVVRGQKVGIGVAEPTEQLTLPSQSMIKIQDPDPDPEAKKKDKYGTKLFNSDDGNGYLSVYERHLYLVSGEQKKVNVRGGTAVQLMTGGQEAKVRLKIDDGDDDTTPSVAIGTTEDKVDLEVNGNTEITGTLNVDGDTELKGQLTVGLGTNSANEAVLLKLNSQRAWQFEQRGEDATTSLCLKSTVHKKAFTIENKGGRVIISGDSANNEEEKLVINGGVTASSVSLKKGEISSDTDDVTIKTGRVKDKTGSVMPVGSVIAFAGPKANVPDGWLICDGSYIPENDDDHNYDDLRSVLAGQTTVPNLIGRFVMGVKKNGYPDTGYSTNLYDKGGKDTHTLTAYEMPSHRHLTMGAGKGTDDWKYIDDKSYTGVGSGSTTLDNANKYYTEYDGSDQSHNNLPPFQALHYIIKY